VYEYFDHTADVGIRVTAADLETLFSDAGIALFGLIVDDPSQIRTVEECTIRVAGTMDETDYLLFDWLNELLRLFEETQLVFCQFDVTLSADGIKAVGRGEPFDPDRHGPGNEVKAVTYHGLRVEPTPGGWEAEVILDI
jgi:SHS2 domain-containing protein